MSKDMGRNELGLKIESNELGNPQESSLKVE